MFIISKTLLQDFTNFLNSKNVKLKEKKKDLEFVLWIILTSIAKTNSHENRHSP